MGLSKLLISIVTVVVTFLSVVAYGESQKFTFNLTEENTEAITLTGILTKPEGKGPFPAIVLLHGCAGPKYWGDIWSKRLNDWGYATVQVDSFGPRGKPNGVCERPRAIPARTRALDAHAAKNYLIRLPFVDAERIAAMGMSHGGSTALAAVENTYFVEERRSDPFRAAVAFYPGCPSHLYRLDAPTLILIGDDDDWTLAWNCKNMELVGETIFDITLKVYPGAVHVFDINRPERTYLEHILRYNPEAAEDAIGRVKQFLVTHLR